MNTELIRNGGIAMCLAVAAGLLGLLLRGSPDAFGVLMLVGVLGALAGLGLVAAGLAGAGKAPTEVDR